MVLYCGVCRHAGVVIEKAVMYRRITAGLGRTWIVLTRVTTQAESWWKVFHKTAKKTQRLKQDNNKAKFNLKSASLYNGFHITDDFARNERVATTSGNRVQRAFKLMLLL